MTNSVNVVWVVQASGENRSYGSGEDGGEDLDGVILVLCASKAPFELRSRGR